MSLKPPKKSDLNKPWMKKPDREIKIRLEYHLIVTEGTDTEPAYFGAIQEIINKDYLEKIQLKVFGMGDNTVSLFEKMLKYLYLYAVSVLKKLYFYSSGILK